MGEYWSIGMDIVRILIRIDHRYNSTEHRSAISFASLLIIPLTSILCYIGFRFCPLMDSVVRSTSDVPYTSQGFSEVCGLRVPETVHFWQPTAQDRPTDHPWRPTVYGVASRSTVSTF